MKENPCFYTAYCRVIP
ncbi:hypothetical protein KGM_203119A, partial [Danaus plexippus plexippus]